MPLIDWSIKIRDYSDGSVAKIMYDEKEVGIFYVHMGELKLGHLEGQFLSALKYDTKQSEPRKIFNKLIRLERLRIRHLVDKSNNQRERSFVVRFGDDLKL